MEITNVIFVIFAFILSLQVLNARENHAKETTKPPNFNPLEDLILNQNKNGPKSESLARVKRQYGSYSGSDSESDSSESDESVEPSNYAGGYSDYYPVPIILPIGGGFGGRGFGGRGFGGRGFGGRGFGGRGFGGRGFGGRGFGGGFGGRGIGGGFGGGHGGRG